LDIRTGWSQTQGEAFQTLQAGALYDELNVQSTGQVLREGSNILREQREGNPKTRDFRISKSGYILIVIEVTKDYLQCR
jgi:hypothetical protein